MIYLDTSVALAYLLTEGRAPPESLWRKTLTASRLLTYEIWTRLHARGLSGTHDSQAQALIGRVALLELSPLVLARALEPFPIPVRTLDAIHLASMVFLRDHGQPVELASYDKRLSECARSLGISLLKI